MGKDKDEDKREFELVAILELLSQTDLNLKSTGKNPRLLLEKLILFICQEQKNVNSG